MPGRLVRIPLWWVVVGVFTCVVTPPLSVWASVRIAEHNARATLTETRARDCDLLGAQLDEYAANPPSTATGRGLRAVYLDQYNQRNCTPPRE